MATNDDLEFARRDAAGRAKSANVLALICGIWFLLTGWMWLYAANLIFSYPVAIVGALFWWKGRKLGSRTRLARVAMGFLIAGLVLSLAALLMYK